MKELGKENITQEFTIMDLVQQAMGDESWESDPQQRAACAMGFYGYVTRFL